MDRENTEAINLAEYEIDNVRKNSSAEKAGLKSGDRITYVNGINVDKLSLEELIGKLNNKQNKRIRLTVQRAGERKFFNFRLNRLI